MGKDKKTQQKKKNKHNHVHDWIMFRSGVVYNLQSPFLQLL